MRIICENISSLRDFVTASMKTHNVMGTGFSLIQNGNCVHTDACGTAGNGRIMTCDTHVEAASLTKPVFAYQVLKLIRRGQLGLNEPLPRVASIAVPSDDPRFIAVTPAMILTHATGLPNWGCSPLPLAFEPGHGFRYSGKAYSYLQAHIEAVTGDRLDLMLQENVFEPFGMKDAAMIWTGPLARTFSRSYDPDGHMEAERRSCRHRVDREPNAAFSLYITVNDYTRFLTGLLADEAVLEMIPSVKNHVTDAINWGLGWGLYGDIMWHWGDNGGFKSFILADPVTKDAFLMHTNSFNGLEVCYETARFITGIDTGAISGMVSAAE